MKQASEYFICGANPVYEIMKAGRRILSVFIQRGAEKNLSKISELARQKNVAVKIVDREFFETRFEKGHQGIAASITPKPTINIDDLLDSAFNKKAAPVFLILDCIEDPRNFGAILRVADAAGIDGVIFQSRRAAGISPLVYKASAGAIEHVNLSEVVNIKHAMMKMKEKNATLIGAEADAKTSIWEIDLKCPFAIVVGSEGEGLRQTVKSMCDHLVSLPMKGMVNSLNVSVATGILAYEALRQRHK